jgi:hypothetical protein
MLYDGRYNRWTRTEQSLIGTSDKILSTANDEHFMFDATPSTIRHNYARTELRWS